MKIATFNCNSIRSRLDILLPWLDANRPDFMCLQETKATDDAFPADALLEHGYHAAFRGEKSYNGVAILSLAPDPKLTVNIIRIKTAFRRCGLTIIIILSGLDF